MKLTLGFVVLIISVLSASAERARFDNYRFYTIDIDNEVQLRALRELAEVSDSYDFSDTPSRVGSTIDVVVPPHQFAHFGELIEKFKLRVTLNSNNYQELVDETMKPSPLSEPIEGKINWTAYQSVVDIHLWMDDLQAEFPAFVTNQILGYSYQNRPMKMIRISKQTGNRAVFIEANIHAREWISGATATYFINELLRSTDPVIQEISRTVDWYIVPISNPDGLEYSRNTNRNWRKTRSPVSATCDGVDPNRNFGYNWLVPDENNNLGASTNPCSDTYAGPRAFSEPETLAIENFLIQNRARFDIFLSFHAYGHLLLFPWGHQRARVSNFIDHSDIGIAARDRLAAVNGIVYTVGGTHETLYAASGVSPDHAYGAHGIPIAYTYEMRGNGAYGNFGFQLPPAHIIPNGDEVTHSLGAMVQKARERGLLN
jgi:carboxypeptidase A